MKPEIAKLWVEALRSGEYQQTTSVLEAKGEQCCLGVLCRLAIKYGVAMQEWIAEPGNTVFDGHDGCLPVPVMEWAGVKNEEGACQNMPPLTEQNDGGDTFLQIADFIEAHQDDL